MHSASHVGIDALGSLLGLFEGACYRRGLIPTSKIKLFRKSQYPEEEYIQRINIRQRGDRLNHNNFALPPFAPKEAR